MKTWYITLACFILVGSHSIINAQAPEWEWAYSAGDGEMDLGRAVATDATGNLYVAGQYRSNNITFGDITLDAGTTSTAMFFVKYDPAGNVIWAKTSEGTGSVSVHDMTVDNNGDIYIVGYISSISFIIDDVTLATVGSDDAFIAKYNPDGNVIWAKSVGSTGGDKFHAIDCDTDGNVYVLGVYNSPSLVFDFLSITNPPGNGLNMCMARYDTNGNAIWAMDMGGDGADWPRDLGIDSNGDILISGDYAGETAYFGFGVPLYNEGGSNTFLAKFNNAGTNIWARSGEGNTASAFVLQTDAEDNIYISGSFAVDALTFDDIVLTHEGEPSYSDFFIAKYDTDGNILWANAEGGDAQDEGRGICLDAAGNVCVAGFFITEPSTFGSTTLESGGGQDILVVSYSPDGDLLWVISAGGEGTDDAQDMTSDNEGNIYLTGFFDTNTMVFGDHELYNDGDWDVFVTKLGALGDGIENLHTTSLSIYPNPFSNNATLQLPHAVHNATLRIYNSLGQCVAAQSNINGQNISIMRDGLAAGIYTLTVVEGVRVEGVAKFIKD